MFVGVVAHPVGISLDGARTIEKMSAGAQYTFFQRFSALTSFADSTRQVLLHCIPQNPIGYRRWFLLPASVMGIVFLDVCWCCGTPGRTRTHDLPVRSRALYPAELRVHREIVAWVVL